MYWDAGSVAWFYIRQNMMEHQHASATLYVNELRSRALDWKWMLRGCHEHQICGLFARDIRRNEFVEIQYY
ncbi:hypothetical protein CEXT_504121 [Caerostris extrusa]|uniref:Uncharacterized protein n=1 Tax=Caerostris extrusa TaxID=172846 RepID=A0AAV4P0D7_CAEEX|nr:hypothetical protein CEXT_504121 [Caerostris extrusa]